MLNRVILIGNTTRPIEFRYANNGTPIAATAIAATKKWNDKLTGDKKEEVMFIDIVIMGKLAEIANQYLTKGKKIAVEGSLKFDQWTDQTGAKRSKHSVYVENFHMLDSKNANDSEPQMQNYSDSGAPLSDAEDYQPQSQPQQQYSAPAPKPLPDIQINDDEIPF